MRNAKSLQAKAKNHQVASAGHDTFTVTSGTSGSSYTVRLIPDTCPSTGPSTGSGDTSGCNGAECGCDWGKYRRASDLRSGCSHVQAVYRHIENQSVRETSTWASEEEARRQHRPTISIGDGIWMTSRSTF